jgi:DNA (cytosine-5)-methyltransferase 1
MVVKPKVIDLFCGCGGFGLGAKLAGFDVTHALDIDATLHSSYEINFPKTAVITADIGKINESDWVKLIQDSPIDGVIGGPPCQGYSRIGKANIDDPRRSLISDFFRNIDIIRPIFFIMENVEGLLDKKNIVELEKATSLIYNNYFIDEPIVVDASEMGAPT